MKTKPITLALAAIAQVTASLAADETVLREIAVRAAPIGADEEALAAKRPASGDAAQLLDGIPGVSLYRGGGVSSLPVIRGLNDDRIKLVIDGMQTTSACGNHMNPSLSYIDPSNVASLGVIAGITPVSLGGDSIAGTITVASRPPLFARSAGEIATEASVAAAYRSVSRGTAGSVAAAIGSDRLSFGVTAAVDHASSYKDGNGNKVRSTLYESHNQALTFGLRGDGHALTVKAGHQTIPYQGFVNQYMDMVGNHANHLNIGYKGELGLGRLEARLYWQDVKHEMGFFSPEKTGTMPMKTRGEDIGYALKADLPLTSQHTARIGHEFHRFTLDDRWPPVPGSMMMEPLTFININDGRRERLALFGELESKWDSRWTTLLGVRGERVRTDTDPVQPYSYMAMMMMPNPDAAAALAFNARDRARRDNNIDVTTLARFEPEPTQSYEFGYARKTRSPNLYERYAWGRGTMAMTMIGWFGDANGYVGDPDLKPEVAHTVSATASWHDAERRQWEFAATPYYTYVRDYIGVNRIGTFNPRMAMGATRALLQFANHNAKLYGIDLSLNATVWDNPSIGRGQVKAVLGLTRGERTDTGTDLYQIMPLNLRLSVEHAINAWTNAVELQLVDRKSRVDPVRLEPETGGYALVNLRTAYQWRNVRFDLSITNLFDRFHYLPLGGVDYADWKANGTLGQLGPVPAPGRSFNAGVSIKF